MPFTAIAVIIIVILRGSVAEEFVGIETSVVLFAVWKLTRGSFGNVNLRVWTCLDYRIITKLEYACLALAFSSLLFVDNYSRPFLFFPLMTGFYYLLLTKVLSHTGPLPSSCFLELIIGQVIFIESFALLYPGFVGVDSYRDLAISQSIVNSAGGLPKDFGAVLWYDFSPTAPLLYAIGNIVSSVPLRLTELLQGFTFPAAVMIALYSMMKSMFSDQRLAWTALVVSSLLPFLWIWASWPIPETLGLAFAILSLVLSLRVNTSKGILGLIPLVVATVLTHGGIAMILIMLLFALYLTSHSKHVLRVGFMAVLIFLTYTVFVYVQGAQFGVTTIWYALLSAFTPSGFSFKPPSIGQGGIPGIVESLVATYWWIFLSSLAWAGLVQLLGKGAMPKYRRTGILLSLVGAVFFSTYFSSVILVTQGNIGRYVGLVGMMLLSISTSLGLVSIVDNLSSSKKRVLLTMLMLLFVISGVCSPLVSPDFWQGIGQSQYAMNNRLQYSTTIEEATSQQFIGNYDSNYYILSNYYLGFVNTINPKIGSSLLFSNNFGGAGHVRLPLGQEQYLVLLSYRVARIDLPNPMPSMNITLQTSDVIYSNPESIATLVFSDRE
jgi:hypothetical protein